MAEFQNWNLGGNILAGYERGRQIGRDDKFRALASQAVAANPAERDALLSQAVAVDPTAGFELGERLNKDQDRRQTQLYNMARGFDQIHKQNPQAAASFYTNQIAPGLKRLGFDVSDQYNEDEVLPVVQQVLAAYGGGQSGGVKVVGNSLVNEAGNVLYQAPQRFQGDDGVYETTAAGGLRRLPTDEAQGAPAQGPVVTNLQGERGRYSIGADGLPVFIAEGVAPNIEQGITANPVAFQQPTAQAPAQFIGESPGGFRPKGTARQEAADRRAEEANQRAREAAERSARGTPPPGMRWNATNTALERIPGAPPPASSVPTVDEKKAATLLKRLEFSEDQLAKVVQADASAAKPNVGAEIARGLPLVGAVAANKLTPESRQRVHAAQLDILDAALTLGTGAAYTREQLEGYRESYFPQIGDEPATIADKQARLKNVIDAAKIAAGRAAPQGGTGGSQGATVPRATNPQTGEVIEFRNGQWVPAQ
jgi:hypothetical protein